MVNISPQGITAIGDNYRYSNFLSPKVLAEKVLRNEATSCSITIPEHKYTRGDGGKLSSTYAPITIPFYMSSDFAFSMSNEFRELVAMGDNVFIDAVNNFNAFAGGSHITPQSEAMSTKVWRGSKFGGFNVDCLFICTNRRNNPVELVKQICTCCLPRKVVDGEFKLRDQIIGVLSSGIDTTALGAKTVYQADGWKDTVDKLAGTNKNLLKDLGMVAPLDYGIQLSGEENETEFGQPKRGTTVTLQIGNWFRATQLVVTSISSISFSKEIIAEAPGAFTSGVFGVEGNLIEKLDGANKYGFPLYGKCTISLEPSSLMHVDKFDKYFLDPKKAIATTIQNMGASYDLP